MNPLKFSILTEDEDSLILVLNGLKRRKPDWPIGSVFKLSEFTDEECEFNFRFTKSELIRLKTALRIPDKLSCKNGTAFGGIEGLCIVLRRFAYPNRLGDLRKMFFRDKAELSMIINRMIYLIADEFAYLLTTLDHYWLSEDYLEEYASAIHAAGSPLEMFWGFIDGTIRPICRPKSNKRIVYNGHKRTYSLKFQSIVTPNGLIANLFGPIEGRRHDCFLLTESKILSMTAGMKNCNGDSFYLYGDPAYQFRPQLQGPFKGGIITPNQASFNKAMSAVRVCVEWEFGKLVNKFAFVQTSKFFGLKPPTLEIIRTTL